MLLPNWSDLLISSVKMTSSKNSTFLLFAIYFLVVFINSALIPIKDSLMLPYGKGVRSAIMLMSPISSMISQVVVAWAASKYGPGKVLSMMTTLSALLVLLTVFSSHFFPKYIFVISVTLNVYTSIHTIMSVSLFWSVASDILAVDSFGVLSGGGTLGQVLGAAILSFFATSVGLNTLLVVIAVAALICSSVVSILSDNGSTTNVSIGIKDVHSEGQDWEGWKASVLDEMKLNFGTLQEIWKRPLLFNSNVFAVMWSMTLGFVTYEKQFAAINAKITDDSFVSYLGSSSLIQALIQFVIQMIGTKAILATLGSTAALLAVAVLRLVTFALLILCQACPVLVETILSRLEIPFAANAQIFALLLVVALDTLARLLYQTISRPVREGVWTIIPPRLKYRSKVMVDVFGHRVGTSVAAMLANTPFPIALIGNIQSHNIWGGLLSLFWIYSCWSLGVSIMARKKKLHTRKGLELDSDSIDIDKVVNKRD